jgi:hypothetical protein
MCIAGRFFIPIIDGRGMSEKLSFWPPSITYITEFMVRQSKSIKKGNVGIFGRSNLNGIGKISTAY